MKDIRCVFGCHAYSQAETKVKVVDERKGYLITRVNMCCVRCGKSREDIIAIPFPEWLQLERKKGKWIVDEKRFGDTERHCSLCGAILEGDDWKWRNNNYCYHCGVKMEVDNE